jgi:hypothetical protein
MSRLRQEVEGRHGAGSVCAGGVGYGGHLGHMGKVG